MPLPRSLFLLALAVPLAGCGDPPPAARQVDNAVGSAGAPAATVSPAPTQTLAPAVPADNAASPAEVAKVEADYLGRWIGVEGMVLDVSAKPGGGVRIENQWDLDHKGSFDGSVTAEGLRWMRGGAAVVARPSDGDATGLKWLAGKKDCLTVKPGEGYCRK